MLAGYIDPGKDLNFRVGSSQQIHIGLIVEFIILDDDMLSIKRKIIPAGADDVEFLGILEDELLSHWVPRGDKDQLLQGRSVFLEIFLVLGLKH